MNLTITSETSKTVKISWAPVDGALGYVFLKDGKRVSNTWDQTKSSVTFGKSDSLAHKYEVVAVGTLASGSLTVPQPINQGILTGTHWPPPADFKTIKLVGYDFGITTVNPGDIASAKAQLDAADAAGIKLILGLYPEPYHLNADGTWTISQAGLSSITYIKSRESSLLAFFVFNEPYWVGKLSAAQLRALRKEIQKVWPTVKVYHDIGAPSGWVPGGPYDGTGSREPNAYANQTGVCDYVGIWDYPFLSDGSYQKSRSLQVLAKECAFAKDKMGAIPVWLGQSSSSPGDGLGMPTKAQLADYNAAIRAALPAGSLISWYVWQQAIYPQVLKGHPELWSSTV